MKKPTMREITIERYLKLDRGIMIEALTPKAEAWMREHAAQFGQLTEDGVNNREWHLWVRHGYNAQEVIDYLIGLWDEQQWPVEIGE